MLVFTVYPLTDPRWSELVNHHRRASVFHSSSWLSALQRTYGYDPFAVTTCRPGEPLKNALVCCKVKSWITGRRLVSLPFSDHCDVMADSAAEQQELLAYVCERIVGDGYSHLEIRSTTASAVPGTGATLNASESFYLHKLSLDAPLDILFRNLHKNCIQRKIRRAEREHLDYVSGRSDDLLRKFYGLLLRTRRRHSLPPQPLYWFRNLIEAMGNNLTVRMVSKGDSPVAAMLTLSHRATVTYKYGCSDERLNYLGGTPFLFWKTIQEARDQGMLELDLGRSDLRQRGLIDFKDRLGATKTVLTYGRYPGKSRTDSTFPLWQRRIAKGIFSYVPEPVFAASGRFLYRHLG
jgi:CelD/BcsL family acetyltransferase involved in cellulose biosynthesis